MTGSTDEPRARAAWRRRLARIAIAPAAVLALLALVGWAYCVRMPGDSFRGAPPDATEDERALARRLDADVRALCAHAERNTRDPLVYAAAADWVERRFRDAGYADVVRQTYFVGGVACHNFEATLRGAGDDPSIVVVGAHDDAVPGSSGADDNASGVAAVLALAERLRGAELASTVRFVAFANEEPPHFQTDDMGSLVYARACRVNGDDVVAMLSFDGIGHYADADGTQRYPGPLALAYPSRGDFVAFVGDPSSRALVRRVVGTFREHARIASEGAVLPGALPGVGWSDHWSFWQCGYEALEITDTLPFRYGHDHRASDVPERLDPLRMARVVLGVESVVRDLAGGPAR